MEVIAKYQLAYKNTLYKAGDKIKMDKEDYPRYINDVEKREKIVKVKPVTKAKTKTKSKK